LPLFAADHLAGYRTPEVHLINILRVWGWLNPGTGCPGSL